MKDKSSKMKLLFKGQSYLFKKQENNDFFRYYSIYYGQKYSDYYFRETIDHLIKKVEYNDAGYFIYEHEKLIGGIFLKPNYMSDLFLIPPFKKYNEVAKEAVQILKEISDCDKPILIQEVIEEHLNVYKNFDYSIGDEGYWMTRPTEMMDYNLCCDYESRTLKDGDQLKAAEVIYEAYTNNKSFKEVESIEVYKRQVENFMAKYKKDEIIYNSSKVIINKKTDEITGVSLHMEFEGIPLITQLAVSVKHQGKGLGRYLISHSITHCSQAYNTIRLYVFENNPAIHLYENMGFIKNRTLTDLHINIEN